jgi:uncharacterized protein (DUF2249 family)
VLDRLWAIKHMATKVVIYDRVDLLSEGRREELIADLENAPEFKSFESKSGKWTFAETRRSSKFTLTATANPAILKAKAELNDSVWS